MRLAAAGALLLAGLSGVSGSPASPPPASPSTAASASPSAAAPAPRVSMLDARLRQVRSRREALQHELQSLRRQEKGLLAAVESLELEVRLKSEQLREVSLELQRTNEQLDLTVQRLAAIQRSIAASRPVLLARARGLYKLGELSYLRLLLSVDHPSDMFRGYRFVTALARRDNERFAAFRADLEAQVKSRAELEQRTQEALQLRAQAERARRELDAERRRKTETLTRIVEKKETRALYVKELEAAESRLTELMSGEGIGDASVPIAAFRGSLPWPVEGRVKIPFGPRRHPKFDTYTIENGIEIEAPLDRPVRAVHEGVVAFADRFLGYGLMVVLDHGAKHYTLYAHLGELSVKPGDKLVAGQVLGTTGAGLDGNGLYFEVRFQGKAEDPLEWLAKPRSARAGTAP
jgi:murein hydrolase activator